MKAKLIKTGSEYLLRDLSGEVLGITIGEINGKLSLKNCQDIERGYDLYELAKENYHKFWSVVDESEMLDHTFGYVEGFRKALGILGDKRFTDKDLDKAIEYGHKSRMPFNEDWYDEFIQSLQQNEWEVEICCLVNGYDGTEDSFSSPMLESTGIPKLDADGCLILKRVV